MQVVGIADLVPYKHLYVVQQIPVTKRRNTFFQFQLCKFLDRKKLIYFQSSSHLVKGKKESESMANDENKNDSG